MQGEVEAWMDGWMDSAYLALSFLSFPVFFLVAGALGLWSQRATVESTECLHIYGSLR